MAERVPGADGGRASDRVEIAIRVTPRAGSSAIDGVDDEGRLCLRVTAPPVDGAANAAVIALLGAELGVRRSAVTVVAGASARYKRVRVEGLSRATLLARWPGLRLGGRAAD